MIRLDFFYLFYLFFFDGNKILVNIGLQDGK